MAVWHGTNGSLQASRLVVPENVRILAEFAHSIGSTNNNREVGQGMCAGAGHEVAPDQYGRKSDGSVQVVPGSWTFHAWSVFDELGSVFDEVDNAEPGVLGEVNGPLLWGGYMVRPNREARRQGRKYIESVEYARMNREYWRACQKRSARKSKAVK